MSSLFEYFPSGRISKMLLQLQEVSCTWKFKGLYLTTRQAECGVPWISTLKLQLVSAMQGILSNLPDVQYQTINTPHISLPVHISLNDFSLHVHISLNVIISSWYCKSKVMTVLSDSHDTGRGIPVLMITVEILAASRIPVHAQHSSNLFISLELYKRELTFGTCSCHL